MSKSVRPAEGPIQVLHVDDDETFLRLAESALLDIDPDLAIQQTTDPTTVLDRIADEEIECIVSDYRMPQLTAIELLERVRSHHPDLPFILCTGHGSRRSPARPSRRA